MTYTDLYAKYGFSTDELVIDEYRSGSNTRLNRNPDGIRVVHIPSGLEIRSHGQRSQYLNRQDALFQLREKLNARAALALREECADATFQYEVEVLSSENQWRCMGSTTNDTEAATKLAEWHATTQRPTRLIAVSRKIVQELPENPEKTAEVVQQGLPSVEESATLQPIPPNAPETEADWEIWMEGYAATGQSAPAQCLGTFRATSFKQACETWARTSESPSLFDADALTYWGCRLYPSEAEARQGFG